MPRPGQQDGQNLTPEQQIEQLRKQLAEATAAREAAEGELERAKAAAQAAQLITSNVMEVWLRKEDAERWDHRKKKMVPCEVDIWAYTIDLPPSGGYSVKINGQDFFHNERYEVDTDTLRTLKDIVARCWAHEANIRGTNENFYRQEQAPVLRGNAGRARR